MPAGSGTCRFRRKIGDVLREQGNLGEALESYRASMAIRERLAEADLQNAGWQYDLALSLARIGLVAAQKGDDDKALSAYRECRGDNAAPRYIGARSRRVPNSITPG